MILKRRDDYARVLRELGGQLFARKGNVDKYFKDEPATKWTGARCPNCGTRSTVWLTSTSLRPAGWECDLCKCRFDDSGMMIPEPQFKHLTYSQLVSCSLVDILRTRVKIRVENHIREAAERESVALRAANESYKSKFAYVAWGSRAGIERLWRTR